MEKIRLKILSVSPSLAQNNTYVVVLGDVERQRNLPIVVGNTEAQSIILVIEQLMTPRPLTHDLMKRIMDSYDIELKEIIISKVIEGVFFSQLICERNGQSITIDSRTSDAIALAVRYNCPIYTYDTIMESLGIDKEDLEGNEIESIEESETFEDMIQPAIESKVSELSMSSNAELESMLAKALEHEDYERAAIIRDELDKRK